ncbi:DUF4386 domain-containing protein [Nocardioides sp.]|uniref:DUF4386 domain-containing protein n=1 Tax=Nocardioides sp. TaxID=35761 RepID=UPI0035189D66
MTTLTAPAPPTAPGEPSTLRSAARTAAIGYAAIFVLAIFANFLAVGSVLHPDDAAATADALADGERTFRLGAAAFLVIFVVDVVLAWALHVLFRGVHHDLSLLAAWCRLTYTVFLGVSLVFLDAALRLVDHDEELVLLALNAFDTTWVVGLAAFGVHLALLGRLLWLGGGPRWLAIGLPVAGAAYVADTLARLLLTDYQAVADVMLAVVAAPSVVFEMSLAIWLVLVWRGRARIPA